jgi:hypothetical protein
MFKKMGRGYGQTDLPIFDSHYGPDGKHVGDWQKPHLARFPHTSGRTNWKHIGWTREKEP